MVAVGGWSGLGGYRAPSGPEASRGVSEGLVTKERGPQVGWGLMAVPCLVHVLFQEGQGHRAGLPDAL